MLHSTVNEVLKFLLCGHEIGFKFGKYEMKLNFFNAIWAPTDNKMELPFFN